MEADVSIDEIIEKMRNVGENTTVEALDLRNNGGDQPDFRKTLERLRDSADGGFVLLLCSDSLSCEEVAARFEHLIHCFPVLDSRTCEVEEGTLWGALVAGTRGAPGEDKGSILLLRAGEIGPAPDATLKDLDLSLVGIRWSVPQSNKGRKSVLRMLRQGIATQADGKQRPTVAGLVALGRSPQTFLPGMRIELSTGTKEVCWRGSLPVLLQKARYYRQPRLASMPFALEEIVRNALLHRDWRPQYHHEPVRISFQERELVCTHPGLLDEDWLVGKSLPPNSAMHALVRRLKPSEPGDPGLQRIDAVLSGMELRPVTLHTKKNWIKVVVPWTEAAPSARTDSPEANSPRPKSRKSSSTHGTARQECLTPQTELSETSTSPPLPHAPTKSPQHGYPRDSSWYQGNVPADGDKTSSSATMDQVEMVAASAMMQGARQQGQNPGSPVPYQLVWTTTPPSAQHFPPSEQPITPPQFKTPAPATWPMVQGFPGSTYAYLHSQAPVHVPSPHIYASEPTYPAQHSSSYSHNADMDTARLPVQLQPVREPPAARSSPERPISMNNSQAPGPNEAAPRPYPTEGGARPVEPRRSAARPKENMRVRKVSRGEVRPTKVGAKNPESTSRGQRVAPQDNKRRNSQPSNHRDSDGVFSPTVRQKLNERHNVEELEVEEVFYLYTEGCYLVDNRRMNRTVPPTLWFIGETVEGRVLKVVFIYDQESDTAIIKTAFEPDEEEIALYEANI